MSSESILSLILRLRKQGGGDKEVAEALDKLKKKSEETKGAFGGLSTGMADVKATFDLAAQAWGAAAKVLDVTVVAAANWGDEMGDLAQLTGTGVKATSEFAATMELLGIKSGDLTKTIKAFTSQGLQPTMENIKRLAAEYQAIQDPVEKNAFLFKNFGKQAGDVAEVLGKSTEELEAFTEAARTSGKVIDEETAEAAEKLNIQLAKLQQRAEGFGIAVGNFVIPSVVGLFEGFDQLTAAAQNGEVSWLEYANRLAAVATGHGTAATLTAGLKDKTVELTDETAILETATHEAAVQFDTFGLAAYGAATASFSLAVKEQEAAKAAQDLKQAGSDLADAIAGPIGKENENYIKQQAELRVKSRELKEELEKLEASQGKQYTATTNSTLSANELTLAQLKLGEAQKKLAEETDPLKQAALSVEIDKLTGKIAGASVTTTGYVDNSKRIGEIKTEIDGVNDAYDANAAKHEEATARIVFGFLQQRMAADGLQDGEITALAKIGRAWGIYDEDTARALEAVDKSIAEHGTNAAAIIKDVGDAIDGLPDTKEIVIQVRTNGAQIGDENFGGWTAPAGSGKPKAGADTQINGMRAAGGPVMGGGAYIVGEQGPELFVPRQSGTVIANGTAGPTYNLNVTTTQSMGRIQDDFALMRAMAGV